MKALLALMTASMLMAPGPLLSVAVVDTSGGSGQEARIVSDAAAIWEANLGVRRSCSTGVTIVFEELSGRRGEYRPGARTVALDPRRPRSGLPATVAHELSHHTFLSCGAFADPEFTDAFYRAQGLPPGRGWFDYGAGWSATPAEHFAEAMAAVTTGRSEGGITITDATRSVVRAWLAGAPLPKPPETVPLPAPGRDPIGDDSTPPPPPGASPHPASPTVVAPPPVKRAVLRTAADAGAGFIRTWYVD